MHHLEKLFNQARADFEQAEAVRIQSSLEAQQAKIAEDELKKQEDKKAYDEAVASQKLVADQFFTPLGTVPILKEIRDKVWGCGRLIRWVPETEGDLRESLQTRQDHGDFGFGLSEPVLRLNEKILSWITTESRESGDIESTFSRGTDTYYIGDGRVALLVGYHSNRQSLTVEFIRDGLAQELDWSGLTKPDCLSKNGMRLEACEVPQDHLNLWLAVYTKRGQKPKDVKIEVANRIKILKKQGSIINPNHVAQSIF